MVKMVKTNEKLFLPFFLFIFLIPVVLAAPISEDTGIINVNQISGHVVLPGNVTYALGHVCTVDYECNSGHCVDGYCCDSACSGSCNSCDVAGSLGTCTDLNSLCLGTSSSCYCSSGSCIACTGSATCTAARICYSPGGGGYGGAGGTTTTTLVPLSETETISPITNGTTGTFNFTNSNVLKITSVGVTVNETVTDTHVTVSETSLPAGANAAIGSDGVVYKYLEITTNIPNSKITEVKIKFKIEKSWLTANGIDVASISLKRYVSGSWVSLPTVKLSEDSTYVYFEATSPGFSLFAITGIKLIVTTTSTVPPTGTSTTSSTSTTTSLPPIEVGSPAMWLTAFLVLIIIGVVIFGLKKKAITKAIMPT